MRGAELENQRKSKLNETWCQNLRNEIDKQGYSQKQVADGTGIDVQSINFYYNGRNRPSFEALVKIAKFLNVSTDFLLGAKDFRSPEKDIQNAFYCTGLNEETVQSLKLMIMNDKADIKLQNTSEAYYYADRKLVTRHSILNFILSNHNFDRIIRALEYSRIYGGVCELYGELNGFGTADDVSVSRMYKLEVYPAFADLINDFDNAVYEAEAGAE